MMSFCGERSFDAAVRLVLEDFLSMINVKIQTKIAYIDLTKAFVCSVFERCL